MDRHAKIPPRPDRSPWGHGGCQVPAMTAVRARKPARGCEKIVMRLCDQLRRNEAPHAPPAMNSSRPMNVGEKAGDDQQEGRENDHEPRGRAGTARVNTPGLSSQPIRRNTPRPWIRSRTAPHAAQKNQQQSGPDADLRGRPSRRSAISANRQCENEKGDDQGTHRVSRRGAKGPGARSFRGKEVVMPFE